jgi:hypothetical protein
MAERPRSHQWPRLELAFGALYLWVASCAFGYRAYRNWRHIRKAIPKEMPWRRVQAFLYFTPRSIFLAVFLAALITVAIDLIFRLLIRPRIVAWYYPRSRDPNFVSPLVFELGAREWIVGEVPARRLLGHRRQPGSLVRTNERLIFYPHAWDGDRWVAPWTGRIQAQLVTTRYSFLDLVRGYPERLVVSADGEDPAVLLLGNPMPVLDWFVTRDGPTKT